MIITSPFVTQNKRTAKPNRQNGLYMEHYWERLAYAMECMQMPPSSSQTHLAKLVGHKCKPQNIQHLLDPEKRAKGSKYTPLIANVLQCDVIWLMTGKGQKPAPKNHQNVGGSTLVATIANEPGPTATRDWPWSVSRERIAALPPDFFGRLDGYIEGRVEEFERAHKSHQATEMGQRAA